MRIAICVNHFHPLIGGSEAVTRRVAQYLAGAHDIGVFTRRVKGRKDLDFEGYRVYEYLPGNVGGFLQSISKFKPDVLFIYSDVFDFFRPLITKPPAHCKLILALCGANWIHSNPSNGLTVSRALPFIHRFMVHSKLDRDYQFCNNPRMLSRTVVIPNGVDLAEFDRNALEKSELASKYKLDSEWLDKRWVLSVSNFFPGKGQNHMFPILERVLDGEFVYLQIATDIDFPVGSELELVWKKFAAKSRIKSKLLKNIPREDVVSFYKKSSVFVFPSEKEVAPLVLLESMAATLPWVSTDVGNALELKGGACIKAVKSLKGHNILDERVYQLFSQAITDLWGRSVFAEAGRQQIEETMNWDKILPQYMSLVES